MFSSTQNSFPFIKYHNISGASYHFDNSFSCDLFCCLIKKATKHIRITTKAEKCHCRKCTNQQWQIVHPKRFVSFLEYKMGVKWIRKNHKLFKLLIFYHQFAESIATNWVFHFIKYENYFIFLPNNETISNPCWALCIIVQISQNDTVNECVPMLFSLEAWNNTTRLQELW